MEQNQPKLTFAHLLSIPPSATALVEGTPADPTLRGRVKLFDTDRGTVVFAEIEGLPNPEGACAAPVFGFHIHDGSSCTGDADDPFRDAGTHYNPNSCAHPYHAGDLPPLFGCNGTAAIAFLTDRFTVEEVMGKAVVIHASPDDFTSQPAGNAGKKIAYGIFRPTLR